MLHPPGEGVVQRAMEEMEEEERVEGRGSGEGGRERVDGKGRREWRAEEGGEIEFLMCRTYSGLL